jgi:hypothetical protein
MTNFKIILLSAIAIAALTASLVIRNRAKVQFGQNEAVLRQQDDQLAELTAEQHRLSKLVSQASRLPSEDPSVALAKLRDEAESLRRQTHELDQQRIADRRWRPSPSNSRTGVNGFREDVVTDSDSAEYEMQLYRLGSVGSHSFPGSNDHPMSDARNLRSALGKYAHEHGGDFPSNLDQAAAYFYKDEPAPHTSDFEMVFQGSLNELTNIPLLAVAVARERQPWSTPRGKWARIYVMADGSPRVVESDDNFQSWEAANIIPPPSAGQ